MSLFYCHPTPDTASMYDKSFAAWNTIKSSNPGKTIGVQQLVEELTTKIGNWDIDIQAIYNRNTSAYKSLFPKHRTPFQSGIASRIIALEALITSIGTDVALASVKTEVSTFLADLKSSRSKQNGQITTIDTRLTTLDEATLAAAEGMFYVYDGLIMRFYKTPKSIEDYIPVALLQESFQSTFVATLKTT